MKNAILIGGWLLLMSMVEVNSDGLSVIPNPIVEETEEIAYRKLLVMESKMKDGIENMIKQALPMVMSSNSDANISSACMGALLKTILAVKDMQLWAFEMIDSCGIPIGGVLNGMASAPGSYSECLNIVIPSKNDKKPRQTGRYCVARVRPPLPPKSKKFRLLKNIFMGRNRTFKTEIMNEMSKFFSVMYDTPLKLGICIPSACTKDDLTEIIQPVLKQVGFNSDIEFCVQKEPYIMDKLQISIIGIYVAFVLINVFATFLDECPNLLDDKKEGYGRKMIRSFSIRRNVTSLVNTTTPPKRSLDCMNGMRYLSTTWVVLCHAYITTDRNMLRNILTFEKSIGGFYFQVIANGFLSVETFMFITAVLITYHVVKRFDSGSGFPFVVVIVRRLLRLLPSLLLTISIVIILPAFGSGPFYKEIMEDQAQLCRNTWWHNILFIANFDYVLRLCLPHSWYLSTEFQCFLIAMVYLVILFKYKKLANAYLTFMIMVCLVSIGTISYIFDFPPSFNVKIMDLKFASDYASKTYTMPYAHVGIYAVGLYLGTFLARNPKIKLSKWTTMVGWPVAFASGMAIVYATYPWNRGDDYSTLDTILYSAFHRTAWGVCLAWVVLACYAERGGVINSTLSWPAFQPLVKMSYLVYLVHIPIYLYISSSKLGHSDASHYTFVFNFFGVLCSSHIIAFVIRILFESPIIQLEAMFFQWLSSRKRKPIEIATTISVQSKS